MTNELTPSRYKEILADVIRLFNDARNRLAEAYWKTGQYVVEIEQGGAARARYGGSVLQKLSRTLGKTLGHGFSVDSLRRMRQFYLENQKKAPAPELPWAHHLEIMKVPDERRRRGLMRKAFQEDLTRDEVRVLVRHEAVRAQVAENLKSREEEGGERMEQDGFRHPPSILRETDLLKIPKLGLFDTCRIKDPNETAWPDKNVLLLDHGFKSYRELTREESRGLKAGDVVEWTGTKLRKLIAPRSTIHGKIVAQETWLVAQLYTYRAYLESVVDGDTLWVMLATGMRGASRQKLRLRGIDCPEIDTEEGKKAKQFVISALGLQASAEGTAANKPRHGFLRSAGQYCANMAECKAGVRKVLKDVPSLTVLSSKNPTYDRYEADVFFMDKTGKEVYLNNLLLQEGYAVKVRD